MLVLGAQTGICHVRGKCLFGHSDRHVQRTWQMPAWAPPKMSLGHEGSENVQFSGELLPQMGVNIGPTNGPARNPRNICSAMNSAPNISACLLSLFSDPQQTDALFLRQGGTPARGHSLSSAVETQGGAVYGGRAIGRAGQDLCRKDHPQNGPEPYRNHAFIL